MKKTFNLIDPKIKTPRLVESTKNEVRKYLKRERRKQLPEGFNYWDFDCKFGPSAELSNEIHISEIDKCIDSAEAQDLEKFYLEILAKPEKRKVNPKNVKKSKPRK